MKVRYKTGQFKYSVIAMHGDIVKLRLEEKHPNGFQRVQEAQEPITKTCTLSHWVMFYIPEINALGAMFGDENLKSKIPEIFVECECLDGRDEFLQGRP